MVETCGISLTEPEKQQHLLYCLKHRRPIVSDTASSETRLTVFLKILAAWPSIRTRDALVIGAEIGGLLTHEQAVQIREQPANAEGILK